MTFLNYNIWGFASGSANLIHRQVTPLCSNPITTDPVRSQAPSAQHQPSTAAALKEVVLSESDKSLLVHVLTEVSEPSQVVQKLITYLNTGLDGSLNSFF